MIQKVIIKELPNLVHPHIQSLEHVIKLWIGPNWELIGIFSTVFRREKARSSKNQITFLSSL